MTSLISNPPDISPVPVPRGMALEFLVAQAVQAGYARQGLTLVHAPDLRRTGVEPKLVLCPCDNGPNNCVTAVTLRSVRLRLEGWLVAELYTGQCPHCRRVYWG